MPPALPSPEVHQNVLTGCCYMMNISVIVGFDDFTGDPYDDRATVSPSATVATPYERRGRSPRAGSRPIGDRRYR